ncbi:DUF1937 family protein [Geovibrio ferrireducens]|uniref:DUF1937 family protein n=1 Tax=Geovibrio ferrireducens TaxID=46201 RepID=UPI002248622F|nr:DUF1937 family protein [Geovibrio ferrireducens]
MSKKIYLAIPYTHEDENIRQYRFEVANEIAAKLMKEGDFVYSPISHSHPLVRYGLPVEWDFWADYDTTFIEWADALYVVAIDGWQTSTGVTAEIKIAQSLGKEIRFISPVSNEPAEAVL